MKIRTSVATLRNPIWKWLERDIHHRVSERGHRRPNIMADEENAEETEIKSPFGPMYLIYRPKGKDGRKAEIIANWVNDPNMKDEKAKARTRIRSSAGFMDFLQPELRLRVHQDHSVTSPDRGRQGSHVHFDR